MRLIDADALKKSKVVAQITTYEVDGHYTIINTQDEKVVTVENIDKAPTIESEPVRHGRWKYLPMVVRRSCSITDKIRCTVCDYDFPRLQGYNFKRCPECGAKMDGGAKNE